MAEPELLLELELPDDDELELPEDLEELDELELELPEEDEPELLDEELLPELELLDEELPEELELLLEPPLEQPASKAQHRPTAASHRTGIAAL